MRIGYEHPDSLLTYPHLNNLSGCQQPIQIRAPFRTHTIGVRTFEHRCTPQHRYKSPNFARNSRPTLSTFEITTLIFQRFIDTTKRTRWKLRATFSRNHTTNNNQQPSKHPVHKTRPGHTHATASSVPPSCIQVGLKAPSTMSWIFGRIRARTRCMTLRGVKNCPWPPLREGPMNVSKASPTTSRSHSIRQYYWSSPTT